MKNMEVNIMGTKWDVIFKEDDPYLKDAVGYCDEINKRIVIQDLTSKSSIDFNGLDKTGKEIYIKTTIRHEVIHAFLSECGLGESSLSATSWATNEEMVDWFANVLPKMINVFKDLKAI